MTYTEDALVEQPAIQLFSDLDWESRNDVVLFARLQTALLKLINDKRFIPLIKKKIVDAKAMKKVE